MEKEYYIEKDFAVLAGPYVHGNKKDAIYRQIVIADMIRGNIPYRVKTEGYNDYIERKGMILTKAK
jgi:hypothetical protein